jgi:hypothetical protein
VLPPASPTRSTQRCLPQPPWAALTSTWPALLHAPVWAHRRDQLRGPVQDQVEPHQPDRQGRARPLPRVQLQVGPGAAWCAAPGAGAAVRQRALLSFNARCYYGSWRCLQSASKPGMPPPPPSHPTPPTHPTPPQGAAGRAAVRRRPGGPGLRRPHQPAPARVCEGLQRAARQQEVQLQVRGAGASCRQLPSCSFTSCYIGWAGDGTRGAWPARPQRPGERRASSPPPAAAPGAGASAAPTSTTCPCTAWAWARPHLQRRPPGWWPPSRTRCSCTWVGRPSTISPPGGGGGQECAACVGCELQGTTAAGCGVVLLVGGGPGPGLAGALPVRARPLQLARNTGRAAQ